jgi:hypothetical protein
MIPDTIVHIWQDPAAKRIGDAYRKGVDAYQETGRLLIAQKDRLGHGEWLPWLKANETALGFGERTARMLMQWADNPNWDAERAWGHSNRKPAADLDEGASDEEAPPDAQPIEPLPPKQKAAALVEVILVVLEEKASGLSEDQIKSILDRVLVKWRRSQ